MFTVCLLCMISLILNVIVINTHGVDIRIEKDMPKWVRNSYNLKSYRIVVKLYIKYLNILRNF